jgi:hypothetical protein
MMHTLVGMAGGAEAVVSCAATKEARARRREAVVNFIVGVV